MRFAKPLSRRDAVKVGVLSSAALVSGVSSLGAMAAAKNPASAALTLDDPLFGALAYPFDLPKLPHAEGAFEPLIDAATMRIHHGRHHAGYIRNLNGALETLPEWRALPLTELLGRLDELPKAQREAIRNNGGGHLNHVIYWETMRPGGSAPQGALAAAIARDFGSLTDLEGALAAAGAGQFGSGWAWLTCEASGQLSVSATPNQDNPLMSGAGHPLFGIDVWEHAYYLNYQNRRGDYLKAYLSLADWAAVSKRYAALVLT